MVVVDVHLIGEVMKFRRQVVDKASAQRGRTELTRLCEIVFIEKCTHAHTGLALKAVLDEGEANNGS